MKFFQNSNQSIFVNKLTTTAIQSRPIYCGAIRISREFYWIMCFVGQNNTTGFQSGQVYSNAA